jgi:hypothetical protein
MIDHCARLLVLGCASLQNGCFQPLDPSAASEKAPPLIALDTPAIDLPDGSTTDPCVLTTLQATEILRTNCAGCHGGGPGENRGEFDFILDFDKLKVARSKSTGMPRFVVPGFPEASRVYLRIARREMPPPQPLGLPPLPRPTVSDISVLYEWIASCLGPPEMSDGGGGEVDERPASTWGE